MPKTKYQEDIKEGNHTLIWGSYYDIKEKKWGFACCHSCVRMSYCVGEAGKQANIRIKMNKTKPPVPSFGANTASKDQERERLQLTRDEPEVDEDLNEDEDSDSPPVKKVKKSKKEKKVKKSKKSKKKKKRRRNRSSGSEDSEGDNSQPENHQNKNKKQKVSLEDALAHERLRQQRGGEDIDATKNKKGYNKLTAKEAAKPSDQEMEAYLRTKSNSADPMAHFADTLD